LRRNQIDTPGENLPGSSGRLATQPRARLVGKNAVFSFAAFLYPTVLTIVVTPIVLHYVGAEGYGIFALATVFVGFLTVLDLGVGVATIRYVTQAVTEQRWGRAQTLVRVSLLVYLVVGLLGCGLATITGMFFLSWFHIPAGTVPAARFVFVGAGIAFFLTMAQNALAAVPPALQRYDITAGVNIVLTTLATVATVAVLAAGLGLRGMIIPVAAEPLLAFFAYRHYAKQLLGRFSITPAWQPRLLREMASFSGLAFVGSVNGIILLQLDKLLLGVLGNARQVAYYVVPGNIAQRIHTASATLNTVVLPSATALNVSSDQVRIARLYVRSTRFTALFTVTVAVPSFLLAHDILRYWLGSSFAAHSTLTLQLLVVTYALLALGVPAYFLALGQNRPGLAAAFNGGMAAINIPLVILLVPGHGSDGAAVAFLVSMLPVVAFVAYIERRVLGIRTTPWLKISARLVGPACLVGLVVSLVQPAITTLPELLVVLALGFIAIPALYLAVLAPAEDRLLVRSLLGTGSRDTPAKSSVG
jgi:O-antigen/teichoic acid export membrane protein